MIPYGFHRQHGIVFLHEQDGGRCVSPGLGAMPSPFTVKQPHWTPCPHRFGASEPGPALDHPMVQAMGPEQAGGVFFVRLEHERWVYRLASLIPLEQPIIVPYWGFRAPRMRRVVPFLTTTNAAPIIITDLAPRDIDDLERLARLPRTRNLIFCGPLRPAGVPLLDPAGLPENHDWPAEGRRQLHRLIRKDIPS